MRLLLLALLTACTPEPGPVRGRQPVEDGTDTDDTDTDGGDDTAPADDSGGGDDTAIFEGPPPAVILFIGDGMGEEHVAGGGLYRTGTRDGLTIAQAPIRGRVRTASLSGYTDSAAAATTLATGHKTLNGKLGLDVADQPLDTLLDLAEQRGMATGVVTTDALTGATPAAFLVHVPSRYDGAAIIAQLPDALPDVLLGGGLEPLGEVFDPEAVQLVTDRDGLAAAADDGRPLVGLFGAFTLPFVAEGYTTEPTLAGMTEAAIARLSQDPEGFVLVVEGARIDHASHMNRTSAVHLETAALDEAVEVALARTAELTDHAVTVLVTADHECGGLRVGEAGVPGEIPASTWRWGDHTNTRVGAYAWGEAAADLDGQEVDNTALYTVLRSAVVGHPADPIDPGRLADGALADLGAPAATQTWETDYGVGWNQLDALRVATDTEGLWVGVDGAFDDGDNAVVVWLDLDYGAGTGVGVDLDLDDAAGVLDGLVSQVAPVAGVAGLGFDAAVGSVAVTDVRSDHLYELGGVRLFHPPQGAAEDLWWMHGVVNFDFTRVARGQPAPDAGSTGQATGGGLELFVPWSELLPEGLPAAGGRVAVAVTLVDRLGTSASNQALPPYASAAAPDPAALPIGAVVVVEMDASGEQIGDPVIETAP